MTQKITDALVNRFGARDIRVVSINTDLDGHLGYRLSFWLDEEMHMLFRRASILDEPARVFAPWEHIVDWATNADRVAEYILAIP